MTLEWGLILGQVALLAGAAATIVRAGRRIDRQDRDIEHFQHLCNAYRAELGEPPLFPDVECWSCNPEATS